MVIKYLQEERERERMEKEREEKKLRDLSNKI
jgi:hypothetical protein